MNKFTNAVLLVSIIAVSAVVSVTACSKPKAVSETTVNPPEGNAQLLSNDQRDAITKNLQGCDPKNAPSKC